MYLKWWPNQWQGLFSLFFAGSKVEIGRRQHLTKVPLQQKRMQMSHLTTVQSLAKHLITPNLLWKSVKANLILQSHMCCRLFWNHIGDQCPLEAISTLNCLKTCRQILTDEWWRSSSLKGDCNISCSHTKSMLLLAEFFYQFMIILDTKFIISNV